MKAGRFVLLLLTALLLHCLTAGSAAAFGFGSGEETSGLDFNHGYDVNTVATVSGRAVSVPGVGEQDNLVVAVGSEGRVVRLALGPERYWKKAGIVISPDDELIARGSKAQGQDGKWYLITQRLTNRTTGAQVELRDGRGNPRWESGSANTDHAADRQSESGWMRGGSMRSGRMMRGGGMMRR
ncbi:hypothetical protein GURASL_00760 [Geotalea uraniireducens]|uniref:SH3 domain-containing protein n=1 Tax=Geotalea uraniireducens TaxID=351604 RepID=A0ABM8EFH8_9BACT|nr:DNA-binding protein [Geotalea uraniireducens]BDV41153.1 hypothetical protein GURASL_00760 [Geotalea uraniireducens]